MDWLFKNKVVPLQTPRLSTEFTKNDVLEEIFSQYENDEISELEFKKLWDQIPDLLIRSRIYPILDGPAGDTTRAQQNFNSFCEDVSEGEVLSSLCFYNGDGSALAYDACLEYLAKSKIKFVNKAGVSSVHSKSSVPKEYQRKIPTVRSRPLLRRLHSLTKRVKFLKKQNLRNLQPDEEVHTSSISSTDDIRSLSSSVGDYETEATPPLKHRFRTRQIRVPIKNYYNCRRQHLLHLTNRSKRANNRRTNTSSNFSWPTNCCSRRYHIKNERNARYILELCVTVLFLFICVTIFMDALFNDNLQESTYERNDT